MRPRGWVWPSNFASTMASGPWRPPTEGFRSSFAQCHRRSERRDSHSELNQRIGSAVQMDWRDAGTPAPFWVAPNRTFTVRVTDPKSGRKKIITYTVNSTK